MLAVGLGAGCAAVSNAQTLPANHEERRFTALERQIENLMLTMPGEYDNIEQLAAADPASLAPYRADNSPARVYVRIEKTERPDLAPYALRISLYRGNDRTTPIASRLYAILPDEEAGIIRIRQFTAQGTADELPTVPIPDCDLVLRRDGDAMAAALASDTCADPLTLTEFRSTPDQFWLRTAEEAGGPWRYAERARRFACMIDVPAEPGAFPRVTQHYISLHDQGGEFTFTHPDGRGMLVFLRNTWSDGMYRETFVVGILDRDYSGKTLAYAWAEPGANRIGINPMFLRVQCDIDSPANRKLQQNLRPNS
jgi:hypothetical protein